MFTFVIGQSKAGKSRYAEHLAVQQSRGARIYIATLIPVGEGEEGAALVRRHRAQREGLGFETVEQPYDVAAVPMAPDATVLLEDVSNLLANNLFCQGRTGGADAAFADVLALGERCENLVAVSFFGLENSVEYDGPTNNYITQLAALNARLKDAADTVVMLENRVPRALKGTLVLPETL